MVRYLMSEPTTRHNTQQPMEGYGDRYVDPYPDRIGEDDPVYRAVMDGIWRENDEGDVYH